MSGATVDPRLLLLAVGAFCLIATLTARHIRRHLQLRDRYDAALQTAIRDHQIIIILAQLIMPSDDEQADWLRGILRENKRHLARLEELRESEGLA